jgi:hypothetical protein
VARRPGVRRGEGEAAREHEIDDDLVALEPEAEELAPPPDAEEPLPDEALELARRRPGRHGTRDVKRNEPPADEGDVEGVAQDGEVGELGHGGRL